MASIAQFHTYENTPKIMMIHHSRSLVSEITYVTKFAFC